MQRTAQATMTREHVMAAGTTVEIVYATAAGVMGVGAVTTGTVEVLKHNFSIGPSVFAQAIALQPVQWAPVLAGIGIVLSLVGWLLKHAINSIFVRIDKLEAANRLLELAATRMEGDLKNMASQGAVSLGIGNLLKLLEAKNDANVLTTNKDMENLLKLLDVKTITVNDSGGGGGGRGNGSK